MLLFGALLIVILLTPVVELLDNGLARTPPMGWLSWQRFRCNTDCARQPDECISEDLYKAQANLLVSDGYRDAGYVYVNIDDCWAAKSRVNGKLVPDAKRFPNGMRKLSDYMHARGLKLGIYADMGTRTCAGYPGSKFFMKEDADSFADWGIDSLKLDGCNNDGVGDYVYGYPIMGQHLNRTRRPILYSCSWPAYLANTLMIPPYQDIAKSCNLWRNWRDIDDSWASVTSIIQWFALDYGNFTTVAQSGAWNDPDMIIVGNYGLSHNQERVQMAVWSLLAAPLYMSNDLRSIRPESKALLLNRRVIAVNQDLLGEQGHRVMKVENVELWVRPLHPKGKKYAVAVLNFSSGGGPALVKIKLGEFGLPGKVYNLVEVFNGTDLGRRHLYDTIQVSVSPNDVFFATATGI